MNWPGEQSVFLKSDCKVMLLWNKSESLKNGNIGTFKSVVDGDKLLVHFEKVSTVEIDQVMWIQRSHQGGTIGVVHQFPLTLGYTIMCHITRARTSRRRGTFVQRVRNWLSVHRHVSCEIG